MTIHHEDPWLTIHGGDCRDVLATLPDASINCVVTSPPYWGLRDYGTASWEGGDAECDHLAGPLASAKSGLRNDGREHQGTYDGEKLATNGVPYRDRCGKCGAIRQDRQLGLEATPDAYVANMVAVFREVRRVLRDDGTLWLNLGDSYAGGGTMGRNDADRDIGGRGGNKLGSGNPGPQGTRQTVPGLKPKDLVGIPWRVAFALQADGWYLRSDIIWAKPNPMPESVTDRPTKAHEYLFLLTKSARYWYDADAVREAESGQQGGNVQGAHQKHGQGSMYGPSDKTTLKQPTGYRNRRTVWTVATQPYPGAHFAVMPEALVEPCILAGCPDKACSECGAPWERVVERQAMADIANVSNGEKRRATQQAGRQTGPRSGLSPSKSGPQVPTSTTTGWKPTCAHDAPTVPGVVLDPFGGSGTVARVANRLSRRAVLIDLSPDYLKQQMERNADMPLGLIA